MTMRNFLAFNRHRFAAAGVLATLALSACGGGSATGDGNTLASIRITDSNVEQPAGALDVPSCLRSQLLAVGTFDDGSQEDLTRRAQWTSSTPAAVRIGNDDGDKGIVSPIGPLGSTATITVEFVGLSASLGVRVSASQLDITAPTPRLAAGTTQQLFADAVIGGDSIVPFNSGVLWTSSKPAVVAVDDVGFVTVVDTAANDNVTISASTGIPECGAGTAGLTTYPLTIRAAALQALRLVFDGCTEANCPVRLPVNVTRILRLLGDFGSAPASIEFTQDLTAQNVAYTTVDPQVGLFGSRGRNALTSVAAGSTSARAEFGSGRFNGRFDETTLTVNSDALTTLTVAPSPAKMVSGTTMPFIATGRFGSNDVDLTRDVSWITPATPNPDDQVVVSNSIGSQGLAFAVETAGVNTTSVSAFRSGFDRNANGTIDENDAVAASLTTGAQVASLTITQPANQAAECNQSGTVPPAVSCQLRATAALVGGGTQDITRSVVWSSSNRAIATASNAFVMAGQVTGIDDGTPPNTATITARFGAISTTFPITVQQPPPPSNDSDGDGVANAQDQCANTPAGQAVNAQGCSTSQIDTDGDGVFDNLDQCAATPAGTPVGATGCPLAGNDADGDGVANGQDQCPNTPAGQIVNAQGCSALQLDGDNDGVLNAQDQCPAVAQGSNPSNSRPGCPCSSPNPLPIGARCLE